MANTVIGFFDDEQEAQEAVERLQEVGISSENIDMATGGTTSVSNQTSDMDRDDSRDRDGNAITRFFNSLFGDDSDDARKYSRVGASSNYIVTVHASSSQQAEDAAEIMDDCGAIDVDERAASFQGGNYDLRNTSDSDRDTDIDRSSSNRGDSINRVEEELQIGKREMETGRVRLKSRIVETPVTEHVRLRREHVNVERNPVDRRVNADDDSLFQERDIELTERAEVPVVNKEVRVVEEVRLNKEVEETDEVVRDTVRRTEVDVDDQTKTGKRTDITDQRINRTDYDDDDTFTDDSRRRSL